MNNPPRPEIQLKYLLRVSDRQVPRLTETLRNAGFSLDPQQDLIAIDDIQDNTAMAYGNETPDFIPGINEFLTRENITRTIPETLEGLRETAELLNLAADQFWWNAFNVDTAWWQDEGKEWTQVLKDYPRPSAAASRNPSRTDDDPAPPFSSS